VIVVYFENMEAETEYIFKQVGVVDPLSVMHEVRAATIRPIEKEKPLTWTDYWLNIPDSLIDAVRYVYRYEILLFQYPDTPFIDSQYG